MLFQNARSECYHRHGASHTWNLIDLGTGATEVTIDGHSTIPHTMVGSLPCIERGTQHGADGDEWQIQRDWTDTDWRGHLLFHAEPPAFPCQGSQPFAQRRIIRRREPLAADQSQPIAIAFRQFKIV
jgi:hypothetical protein